jgi:hypothetical protein
VPQAGRNIYTEMLGGMPMGPLPQPGALDFGPIPVSRASDIDALHKRLRAEDADGLVSFNAHDQADTVAEYLADLALARQDYARQTDEALQAGRIAPTLLGELRYLLMAASINSLTEYLQPELRIALVTTGLWTPAVAVARARRLADASTRAYALATLAPYLSSEVGVQAEVEPIPSVPPAVHLSADQIAEGLAAAKSVADDVLRAWELVRLMPHVSDAPRADLLAQVMDIARAADSAVRRRMFVFLLPYLPAGVLAGEVLAVAVDASEAGVNSELFLALLPHLPPAAIAEALAAVVARGEKAQFWALTGLAPYLSPGQLSHAVQAAAAIAWNAGRVNALVALATYLPADQQAGVIAQALAAATEINDTDARLQLLQALASPTRTTPLPGEPDLDQVIHMLRAAEDDVRAFVPMLRSALSGIRRDACFTILPACLPVLAAAAGPDMAAELTTIVQDVHRWWP